MSAKPVHGLVTVVMNVFVLLAVALAVRIILMFFGALASLDWANTIIQVTDIVTPPLGVEPISTPYGGVFDVEAALTVFALLVAEWGLGAVRDRA